MSNYSPMKATHATYEFNYSSIMLEPYSNNSGTSTQILKDIIKKINESEKKIIDRHKNRAKTVARQLVVISNTFEQSGLRCFGKIALIKNKTPMLWAGKDIVEEIEKASNKEFIEVTNYSIHFTSNADPIIMYEFNSEGPRLSDLEFYIRQIGKESRFAKSVQTSIHLKTTYEQLDKELKNIFQVTVKVNSTSKKSLGWLQSLNNLNEESDYKDVRLELFFNRKKDPTGKYVRNTRATDFARKAISWLKNDKRNIKHLDDLKMTYLNEKDETIELDFIKNKVASILEIPLIDGKVHKPSDLKSAIAQEFNKYLKDGTTSSNP